MADERTEKVAAGSEEQPAASFRVIPQTELGDEAAAYSNFVQVGFSPHDFRLHFGSYSFPPLLEPPEGQQIDVPVEPVATVAIPLNLVKGLVRALETQIGNWERGFNEPLPDQPKPQDTGEGTA